MSTPEPAYVTPRGFTGYADLTDRYGASLRVQGSSLATEPCVWIFAETGSAHLTVEQARTVRDALTNWLNEHTADRPPVTDEARDHQTAAEDERNALTARLAAVEALAAEWERENRRGPAS